MKAAVFLDRDGVLNELVLNPATRAYEPPHRPKDLRLVPHAVECLKKMQAGGYALFLVSNQPDYAKEKASLEALEAVHRKFDQTLGRHGVRVKEYYYCFHHPQGTVPGYSGECACRKPKPFFVLKARKDHGIRVADSWFVGDRDTDIECGRNAGTKTILIVNAGTQQGKGPSAASQPDYRAKDLVEATGIIVGRGPRGEKPVNGKSKSGRTRA